VTASEAFASLRDALRADLGTRFPAIDVEVRHSADDGTSFFITDGGVPWGDAYVLWDDNEQMSDRDAEQMFLDVLSNVADNLWPDEATDLWPPCPAHHDHPLQPGLHGGRAGWVCLRDSGTFVRLGGLDNTDA